ncbi:hypothetical protein OIE90_17960 [Streptomyces cellulosae]|nr:hypothetical protein OG880_17770 [Streptomyces cellulosae]WTB70582.1 hypothetical protein OIE90_17960 [Streptomyces cellulosae]
MSALRVHETRLENISSYEFDGPQRAPFKVQFTGVVGEVQPLNGKGHFASPVQYPPGLGIVGCLATARGIADRIRCEGSEHHSRVAEGEDIVAPVASIAESPPGQTLSRSNSDGPVSVMQSRRRGYNRPSGHLPFENVGEDVAGVPEVLVQRRP